MPSVGRPVSPQRQSALIASYSRVSLQGLSSSRRAIDQLPNPRSSRNYRPTSREIGSIRVPEIRQLTSARSSSPSPRRSLRAKGLGAANQVRATTSYRPKTEGERFELSVRQSGAQRFSRPLRFGSSKLKMEGARRMCASPAELLLEGFRRPAACSGPRPTESYRKLQMPVRSANFL